MLLKDTPHVVEEPGSAGEQGWQALRVVKEILGVWIALPCSQCEPVNGGLVILRDVLSQQVQLAQGILGKLVSLFR